VFERTTQKVCGMGGSVSRSSVNRWSVLVVGSHVVKKALSLAFSRLVRRQFGSLGGAASICIVLLGVTAARLVL
jgi:hypothetical protein